MNPDDPDHALKELASRKRRKMRPQIYASATVDVLFQSAPASKELSRFRVEVWGREPHDYVRVYEIAAKDDNMAAREGLDRFIQEIGDLLEKQGD